MPSKLMQNHPIEWVTDLIERTQLESGRAMKSSMQRAVASYYLQYAFSVRRTEEVNDALEDLGLQYNRADFHASVRSNGLLLQTFKAYYVWKWAKAHPAQVNVKDLRLATREFDRLSGGDTPYHVPEEWRDLYSWLHRSPAINAYVEKIAASPEGFMLMSPYGISRAIQEVLEAPDIREYIGRYISLKFRFLLDAGRTRGEITDEMNESIIFKLTKAYPKWHHLGHLKALAKNAIKQRGNSIIDNATAASRNDLYMTDSLDTASSALAFAVTLHGTRESTEECDLRNSLIKAVDMLEHRAKRWAQLMLGTYDEGLSIFIGVSNSDAATTWRTERYSKVVCEYLAIPPTFGADVLKSIRASMGG